jgi:hypothetical protein
MILRNPFMSWQPWDYMVTDQILLKEEEPPKSKIGVQQDNTNNTERQTPSRKKHFYFTW